MDDHDAEAWGLQCDSHLYRDVQVTKVGIARGLFCAILIPRDNGRVTPTVNSYV